MDIWLAGNDVFGEMQNILREHHPQLLPIQDEIAVIFREKAAKRGGKVSLGATRKASSLLSLLGQKEYKFVIELAADEWQSLPSPEKTALLDHYLCACGSKEVEKTGETKWFVEPPDVMFYWDELDRYGAWRSKPEEEEF
jgi:hypothetical protein